ncbi:MAG TPA: acetyl-CoA carboxylase carboxyltransferase subunit alpha [Ktedonobacteraceae bacterium]|nr:acetyl-CoA carboxylase carboxyltransferase subunit alpha [Ktedonobacteraceae bacterium]
MLDYDLEFEKPLAALAEEIRIMEQEGGSLEHSTRLRETRDELVDRTREIYAGLTAWQTVQVARHKDRPRAADYIQLMCDDFLELHGDRTFGDDPALLAGLATFNEQTVVFIAQHKGRGAEQALHNFGMPHPEGYRKAYRLMKMAWKFNFPLVCLIDTPGAFPGLGDEERGQSEAIASNLYLMSHLPVPIVSVVIGEGGSGGALGISVADRLLMQQHSVYTVAAPEAAASILWRDKSFAPDAANAMRISAQELIATQIIDGLVTEPLGGAHRDNNLAADYLKAALQEHLDELGCMPVAELLERRYQKFRSIGKFSRATPTRETRIAYSMA